VLSGNGARPAEAGRDGECDEPAAGNPMNFVRFVRRGSQSLLSGHVADESS
jgi:hypothetical protein